MKLTAASEETKGKSRQVGKKLLHRKEGYQTWLSNDVTHAQTRRKEYEARTTRCASSARPGNPATADAHSFQAPGALGTQSNPHVSGWGRDTDSGFYSKHNFANKKIQLHYKT